MDGDLERISSIYNSMLDESDIRIMFENYGIYYAWLHCSHPVREGLRYDCSIIQIVIFYSEDSTIYIHKNSKVFLLINIPAPSNHEYLCK